MFRVPSIGQFINWCTYVPHTILTALVMLAVGGKQSVRPQD